MYGRGERRGFWSRKNSVSLGTLPSSPWAPSPQFYNQSSLLLSGKDVNDAIWPHAYRALQATMFLRENITLLFFLALMLFFTSLITVKSQLKGQALNQNLRRSLLFILGLFSGLTALYFLLDIFYLRGAFLLLPTLYGMILLSTLLAVGGLPRLPDGSVKGSVFFPAERIFVPFSLPLGWSCQVSRR